MLPLLISNPSLEPCNHQAKRSSSHRDEDSNGRCHEHLTFCAFTTALEESLELVAWAWVLELVVQLEEAGAEVRVVDFRVVGSFEPTDPVAQEVFPKPVLFGQVRDPFLDFARADAYFGGAQTGPMGLSACGFEAFML